MNLYYKIRFPVLSGFSINFLSLCKGNDIQNYLFYFAIDKNTNKCIYVSVKSFHQQFILIYANSQSFSLNEWAGRRYKWWLPRGNRKEIAARWRELSKEKATFGKIYEPDCGLLDERLSHTIHYFSSFNYDAWHYYSSEQISTHNRLGWGSYPFFKFSSGKT